MKNLFRIIGILVLWPGLAQAGTIGVINTYLAADNAAVASTSSFVNVPPNLPNPALIVLVGGFDNVTFGNTAVNSVTYDALNLTKAYERSSPPTNHRMSVWVLTNPPTGKQTLTVTWAGALVGGHVHAIILSQVDPVNPINVSSGSTVTASPSPFSLKLQNVTDRGMVLSLDSTGSSLITSAGNGQIIIAKASNNFWWSSYTVPAVMGDLTHSYANGSASDQNDMMIVSVNPDTVIGSRSLGIGGGAR